MADRYTITNNVIKDYDLWVIEQRVANPTTEIISFRDRVQSQMVTKKLKKDEQKKTQPDKIKFLEFVYLQETEYSNLITSYGTKQVKDIIQRLNDYIGSKGDKYKNHYRTCLSRFRQKWIQPINNVKNIPMSEPIKEQKVFVPLTEDQKKEAITKLLEFKQKLKWN